MIFSSLIYVYERPVILVLSCSLLLFKGFFSLPVTNFTTAQIKIAAPASVSFVSFLWIPSTRQKVPVINKKTMAVFRGKKTKAICNVKG
jgi:hypothetical protein